MKNLLVRGLLIILILFMGFFFADFSCLISIVGNNYKIILKFLFI